MVGLAKALALMGAILASAILIGLGPSGLRNVRAGTNDLHVVDMDLTSYKPTTIIIRAGESVQWRNSSTVPHHVTTDAKFSNKPEDYVLPEGVASFSQHLPQGEVFSYVFTVPGTYHYFCTHHQSKGMVGVVIVESAS